MAAAKFVAVVVLPCLLQLGSILAVPVGHEAAQARRPTSSLRRPDAGHENPKSLVVHGKTSSRRLGLRDNMPEQLEMWKDSGHAVQSMLSTDQLTQLTAGITTSAYQAQLHEMVDPSLPSRFLTSKGNSVAAANIKAAFEKLGLQTEVQALDESASLTEYGVASTTSLSGNILGYLKGSDRANEVVIIACHYDSVNWRDGVEAAAPGVDDNGSGCALMLLLAKTLSQNPNKPRRSMLFVAFQAEEVGLVGSKAFANQFVLGGSGRQRYGQPVAAFVADEVAWPGKTAASRKVIFETKGRGQGTDTVVDTLASASQTECNSGLLKNDCVDGFVVNYHGFGSDHISLLNVGIPAVLIIERDNMFHADEWGHSAEDTFQHIDPAFGAAITRLALHAAAVLANPSS